MTESKSARPRVLVVNGPGVDLSAPGLVADAPETWGRLAELCHGWGADVGLELEVVSVEHPADVWAAAGSGDSPAGLLVCPGDPGQPRQGDYPPATVPRVVLYTGRPPTPPPPGLLIHGRGVDGYLWGLRLLAAELAWPRTTLAYGADPDHRGDLRLPAGAGPHPVVVLLHGGYWLDAWQRDLMSGLAVDLAQRGLATWNLEYRRLGRGGGWPATGSDVEAGIEQLRKLSDDYPLDLGTITVLGHSAGAQLAVVATAGAGEADSRTRADRLVLLAGVTDLEMARRERLGGGAVDMILGGNDGTTAWMPVASPIEVLPLGIPQLVVHMAGDRLVPISQSRRYAAVAAERGDEVDFREIPGGGHFDLIDPRSGAWAAVAAHVAAGAGL